MADTFVTNEHLWIFMSDINWTEKVNPLIYRIQRQDKYALNTLYELVHCRLFSIILRIVKNHQESEDILQEVFIKVWGQANKYSGTGSAWGWLCVLTRNTALDRIRSLGTHPQISLSDDDKLYLGQLFNEHSLTQECSLTTHSLDKCINSLKSQARNSILMSFIYGYSHAELANELSVPLGTAKAWIRRGLKELKQCLAA